VRNTLKDILLSFYCKKKTNTLLDFKKKNKKLVIGFLLAIFILDTGIGFINSQNSMIQIEEPQNAEISSTYIATASNANLGTDNLEIVLTPNSRGVSLAAYAGTEYEFDNPTMGNVSVLVIPVYFPDETFSTSTSVLQDRWDSEANSVQKYYMENSFNRLNISVEVLSWTLANNTIAYYGDDDYQYPREFDLIDYLVEVWDDQINFNEYDYFYFTYSGEDLPDDTHLWPHVWTFYSGAFVLGDGRLINKIGFVGEESGMGTICHEFGHSLGLMDYYDTSIADYTYVGNWELMGSGNYNGGGDYPSNLGLYSKMELGWITEDQIYDLSSDNICNLRLASISQLEIFP